MTPRGLHFGRLDGVPVYVDYSWFVFAPIIGIALAKVLGDAALGAVGVVLIYLANLGHEYAHVAQTRRANGVVHDVILFALGTIARTAELPDPRSARRVAFAGPLYSLILGLSVIGLGIIALVELQNPASPIVCLTFTVGAVTLAFGFFFNLLPIWPMDGGRVLRASLRLAGHSRIRSASLCLGLTLALCGGAILWGALQFAVAGSLFWWPKMLLAALLIANALGTYRLELREQPD